MPLTPKFTHGAADYTICYYRQDFDGKGVSDTSHGLKNVKLLKTTSSHQLALSVIYYSPLQYLYWYDRPEDSQDEPELAFFDAVPTVWDETVVLSGMPGQSAAIVRKSGDDWFLGCITNNDKREVSVPLSFLDKGKTYKAVIYEDGDKKIKTRTKVKISEKKVNASQQLTFSLKPSGGIAIHFKKE